MLGESQVGTSPWRCSLDSRVPRTGRLRRVISVGRQPLTRPKNFSPALVSRPASTASLSRRKQFHLLRLAQRQQISSGTAARSLSIHASRPGTGACAPGLRLPHDRIFRNTAPIAPGVSVVGIIRSATCHGCEFRRREGLGFIWDLRRYPRARGRAVDRAVHTARRRRKERRKSSRSRR